MDLYEYQARDMFEKHGVPVLAGVVAIDDGLTAMDWLLSNAESLELDPERIGLLGGSAGAITTVHLGYVLDNYGVAGPEAALVVDFWGENIRACPG